MQVPFTIPLRRVTCSPPRPCSIPGITGTPPSNRGSVDKMNLVLRGQLRKTYSTIGNQLLIRRYNRLARSQSLRIQPSTGFSAHQLDHDIHVRAQYDVDVVRPYDGARYHLRGC